MNSRPVFSLLNDTTSSGKLGTKLLLQVNKQSQHHQHIILTKYQCEILGIVNSSFSEHIALFMLICTQITGTRGKKKLSGHVNYIILISQYFFKEIHYFKTCILKVR